MFADVWGPVWINQQFATALVHIHKNCVAFVSQNSNLLLWTKQDCKVHSIVLCSFYWIPLVQDKG